MSGDASLSPVALQQLIHKSVIELLEAGTIEKPKQKRRKIC